MANPRKFADKLDIIKRKQEETDAAFEQVMREVSDARTGFIAPPHPHGMTQSNWPRRRDMSNFNSSNIRQRYKGGSLPNFNVSQNPQDIQAMNYLGHDHYNVHHNHHHHHHHPHMQQTSPLSNFHTSQFNLPMGQPSGNIPQQPVNHRLPHQQ